MRFLAQLKCRWFGHGPLALIEAHSAQTLIRIYLVIGGKIIPVPPHRVAVLKGKFFCTRCQKTILSTAERPCHEPVWPR